MNPKQSQKPTKEGLAGIGKLVVRRIQGLWSISRLLYTPLLSRDTNVHCAESVLAQAALYPFTYIRTKRRFRNILEHMRSNKMRVLLYVAYVMYSVLQAKGTQSAFSR